MERELKLRVPVEGLEKLCHAPLLAQSESAADAPRLLTSTYFDTPELAFHSCGASLRVRVGGGERLQTLKFEGSARAGLFDRDEFQMPIGSDTPDLKLLQDQISADTDCGKLIRDEATAARLKPVFVTRINRSAIPLHLPSGDELEVVPTRGPSRRTQARFRSRLWKWS